MQKEELVKIHDHIVGWIRDYVKNSGGKTVILGMSGGADSTVAGRFAVEAVGPENVIGVFMPCGYQPDIQDAYDIFGFWCMRVMYSASFWGSFISILIPARIG